MNKSPTVSVIIGVHNKAPYLRQCIDSVLNQTYTDYELIIVDDCSTDDSPTIIRMYADRIRVIRLEKNTGLPAIPRNIGIKNSTGKYIAFLDADDYWEVAKLEKQMECLSNVSSEIGLCHTYVNIVDEHGRFLRIRHDRILPPTGDCYQQLLRHCFISTSSVLIRKSVLDDVGLFNQDPSYRCGEDYELFIRISYKYQVALVDTVLASYREAEKSVSRTNNWKGTPEHVPSHVSFLNRTDLYRENVTKSYLQSILLDACNTNSQYWRDQGFYGHALWFVWTALRHKV